MKTVMANEVDGDMGNAWLKTNSAGTGAYVLKSFKPNEGYVLEARPGYWRGDAKMANVFMQHVPEAATQRLQLEKGDIDIARELTPTDIEGMAGNADVKIQNDVGGQIYYLSFNQKNENYKNPKFLDAMRWAIDYTGMTDTLPEGHVSGASGLPAEGLSRRAGRHALHARHRKGQGADGGIGHHRTPKIVLDRAQRRRPDGHGAVDPEHLRAGRHHGRAERGRRGGTAQATTAPASMTARCRPGARTIPIRTPTPRPSPMNPDNSDEANNTGYLAWRNA